MEIAELEAVASSVANRDVRAVRRTDSVYAALRNLKEYGVAILVDDQDRPIDILTSCDLTAVVAKAQDVVKETLAAQIFEPGGRTVYSVPVSANLLEVARIIAREKLGTGIVVVDGDGRYAGYIFNRDLQQKAEEISAKAQAYERDVKSRYPDAWSTIEKLN